MVRYNQLIFLKGKEKALDALFNGNTDEDSTPATFGYLALGYDKDSEGFEDPDTEDSTVDEKGGFKEIINADEYERIPLKASPQEAVKDTSNNQVIKKYEAELPADKAINTYINQFAICDSKQIDSPTTFYSAATFKTFFKTSDTSITFIIGFKI